MTSAANSTIENLADAPAEDRLASAIGIVARQFPGRTAIVEIGRAHV